MRGPKACLLLLAVCLGIATAQEASSVDADGNTVVYSVGLDEQGLPTTAFLETIPAAADVPALPAPSTSDLAPSVAAPPGGVLPDPTSNPVITRDNAAGPDETTLSSRPVTYVVYYTVDGLQVTSIATFTPKTPSPTTTIPPLSGTMVDIATYLPPPPSSTTTSSASKAAWPSSNAYVATLALMMSMLIGALAV